MKFVYATAMALFAAAASAAPTSTVEKRSSICGQWDSVTTGVYTLYQDLWNEAEGSGSQCSQVKSLSGSNIAWSTSWSWADNSNQVKSYANVVTKVTSTKLSGISKIASVWDWSYTGSNIVADVSYDIFTSATSGGSNAYEIMIWLAALGGAGPISSTGSAIATVTLAGHSFKLYKGLNGSTTVFSFVAVSEVTSFSGDIKTFLTYLINNQGLSSSQYLTSIGAGTEPFTGSSAVFTTSDYSLTVTY
ncbi:hypothetical protein MBLNU459_g0469t1 [Dothideomycetes sp. NU459]